MTTQTTDTPARELPGGIKLLAWVALFIALAKLIFGLLGLGLGAVMGLTTAIFWGDAFWGSTAAGTGQLLGAAIWGAVGFGLRGLKQWAWLVAVIAAGYSALTGVQSFLTGGALSPVLATLDLVIAVAVLIYLFRPHVTQLFGR